MARILFTWELGRGFGHLAEYREVFGILKERGHSILMAVRDLANAEVMFGSADIPAAQAPILSNRAADPVVKLLSYAQLLRNIGFGHHDGLLGRIKAWRYLYDSHQPDLVLYDHSPTAMLAFHSRGARQLVFGNGFLIPPLMEPLPAIRYWETVSNHELLVAEKSVLICVNGVLEALDEPPLPALRNLFERARPILRTVRELDHYPNRTGFEYFGLMQSASGGAIPRWAVGSGPRIFGYLYPFRTLPALLQFIRDRGYRCLVYAPEVGDDIKRRYECGTLQFAPAALAMDRVCGEADVAITNGNFNTTAALLLAGRPVLLLPLDLEKYMVGRRVEQLGAGLVAPGLTPAGMAAKLQALIEDSRYRQAAIRFADRYRGGRAMQTPAELADLIEAALAG